MLLNTGNKHEGLFVNGRYEGPGRFYSLDGKVYEGLWRGGHRDGPGTIIYPNGKRVPMQYSNGQVVKPA